jgi:hypothetical protein
VAEEHHSKDSISSTPSGNFGLPHVYYYISIWLWLFTIILLTISDCKLFLLLNNNNNNTSSLFKWREVRSPEENGPRAQTSLIPNLSHLFLQGVTSNPREKRRKKSKNFFSDAGLKRQWSAIIGGAAGQNRPAIKGARIFLKFEKCFSHKRNAAKICLRGIILRPGGKCVADVIFSANDRKCLKIDLETKNGGQK